jgi:hypothetical protein
VVAKFEQDVRQTCEDSGLKDHVIDQVLDYFRDNWWCDPWRGKTLSLA